MGSVEGIVTLFYAYRLKLSRHTLLYWLVRISGLKCIAVGLPCVLVKLCVCFDSSSLWLSVALSQLTERI